MSCNNQASDSGLPNNATIISITVTSSNGSVINGLTQQMTATGIYENGGTADITTSVTWSSNDTAVAEVDAKGLVTGLSPGQVTITAKSGSVSGTAELTINAAVLTSITVTPGSSDLITGLTRQMTATGNYDNGQSVNLSSIVTWTSSNSALATVNANGLVSGISAGTVTIAATSGFVSGSADLTIKAATLSFISISPGPFSMEKGNTMQMTAKGNYDTGGTADLTLLVVWASSDTNSATVSAGGLVTAVIETMSVTISATYGGITGSTILSIVPAAPKSLVSIAVAPGYGDIDVGATQQMTATGNYEGGGTADITSSVTWASSNNAIATVDTNGLVSGVSAGTVDVTATSGLPLVSGTAYFSIVAVALPASTFVMNLNGSGDVLYTEAWTGGWFDPMIVGMFDNTAPQSTYFFIGLGYDDFTGDYNDWIIFSFPGQSAGAFSLPTAGVMYLSPLGIYMPDDGTYTSTSITVSQYGAVSQKIKGSYNVTLCAFFADCSLPANLISLAGSFDITRQPNIEPEDITGLVPYSGRADNSAGYFAATVLEGNSYTITMTGLTDNADLFVYNNDATFAVPVVCADTQQAGTTSESCVLFAFGNKMYIAVDVSNAASGSSDFILNIN